MMFLSAFFIGVNLANPQPDQYTKISNELLEQLANIRISGEAMQIFLVILRKTYGYGKKQDLISLSQFSEATGINKPCVVRAINKLTSMRLIIKNDNGVITSYCIQKDYDLWKPLSKKIISIIKKDNQALSKKIHTKESFTKENKTKGGNFSEQHPKAVEIVQFFIDTMNGNEERLKPKTDAINLKWLKCANWAIKKMGNHGNEKVIDIITAFRDPEDKVNQNWAGWHNNFQSLLKLQKTNKDGNTYLDVFWSKIENRCSYGSG